MSLSRSRHRASGGSRTPRDSPASLPLWREVIQVEQQLRPTVRREESAQREGVPYVRIVASVLLAGGAAVVGGVYLYRGGLVRARLDRPPKLQGEPIVPLPQLLRRDVIKASWQLSAGTFAGGLVLWLLLLAIRRTRRLALRWAIVPLALGVAAALYGQWWYANAF